VAGAVLGALVFGRLTDRLGRKKLFLITLVVYTVGTLATAFSPDFAVLRAVPLRHGLGIGGEYAAINSAIDELIPARVRGRVNLAINGSFWIGAALGAALSLVLLDARVIGPVWGWRAGFALGAVLAVAILLVRRHVPESPRWLIAHGRADEAERIVAGIEREVQAQHGPLPAPRGHVNYTAARANSPSMREVARVLLRRYRQRSVVAAGADGLAGLLLQRDLLHLRAGAHPLLRRARGPRGALHLSVRAGQRAGAAAAGAAVRQRGPAPDDRADLCARGCRPRAHGLGLHERLARCAQPGAVLVGGVLPRLGRGEFGLPHGQRSVPAGDARHGHRDLLCHRHGRGRLRGAGAVRR
jgi:MFS family permease